MSKEAEYFIKVMSGEGYKPVLQGEWVKWSPPLPANHLMEAIRLSDDIAKVLAPSQP